MNEEDKKIKSVRYQNVLISVANPANAKHLIRLAKLVTTYQSTLHIINVTLRSSYPQRGRSWREGSDLVMEASRFAHRVGRMAKPVAATAENIPRSIINAAKEIEADLILLGWFGRITPLAVRKSRVVNKVLHKSPCDTIVYKSRGDLKNLNKIMIPVGRGPNQPRLEVAQNIIEQSGAEADLVHIILPDQNGGRREDEAKKTLSEVAQLLWVPVNMRTQRARSVIDGLVNISGEYDLSVIDPGREWVFNRFLFGRNADELTNRARCSVLMYKSKEYEMAAWFRGLWKAITGRIG